MDESTNPLPIPDHEHRIERWHLGQTTLTAREGGIGVVGMGVYLALVAAFGLAQASAVTTVVVVMACLLGVAMVWKPARSIRFDGPTIATARVPGAYGPAINFSSFDSIEIVDRPRRLWPGRREIVLSGARTELRIRIDDMADRHRDTVLAALSIGFGPDRLRLPLSN